MLTKANKKRGNLQFKVSDEVLISTKHPLFQTLEGVKKPIPAWSGPFRITQISQNTSCVLEIPDCIKTNNQFHTSLLKFYHPRKRMTVHPSPTRINRHDHYEADRIIGYQQRRLGKSFIEEHRVAFIKYGPEYNRWLLIPLLSCIRKVAEYHTRRRKRIRERGRQRVSCFSKNFLLCMNTLASPDICGDDILKRALRFRFIESTLL